MILVKPMKINRENRVYKLSKSFKFNDPFVDDHYKKALISTQKRKQIHLSTAGSSAFFTWSINAQIVK